MLNKKIICGTILSNTNHPSVALHMSLRLRNTITIAVAFIMLILAGSLYAESIDIAIETGINDLAFSKVRDYDLVELTGDKCSLDGETRAPWLPFHDVHVLLPEGVKAISVKAGVEQEVTIDGDYFILPTQKATRLSALIPEPFIDPDPEVYDSVNVVPADIAILQDTIIVRGFSIAIIRVYPVTYIPATGKLALRSKITLSISIGDDKSTAAVRYRTQDPIFEELISRDVINPGVLTALSKAGALSQPPLEDDIKYLIIGRDDMADEFQPLIDWKTKKGVPAEYVTTSWIYSSYSGSDNQEEIKLCIKDYVENKGTVWVVLAGDNTIIPDRDCYGNVNSGDTTDTTIPTDLYYAGLDDMDWDDDNDNVCAEVGDDTIDMGPDVYVGRFPIRTETHATTIVDKILYYEKNCPSSDFAEKMVLCGDQLWDPGDAEDKSEVMYDSWIDPYWDPVRKRFYDTNTDFPGGAGYNLDVSNLNEQLEAGYNFLHMATHGSQTTWGMETGGSYYSSTAQSVNNTGKYTNIVTIACTTNAFEDSFSSIDPCLSEGFLRNPDGGAVTYIGGSRFGWGISGTSSHGSSFKYDRMFYEFLFTDEPSAHPRHVGAVYTKMKQYWAGSCSSYGSMRWCQFSVNLAGDPEMPLYTADPLTLSPSYSDTLFIGSQIYVVETGVASSKVCLMKKESGVYEVYAYGVADGTGHFEVSIDPETVGDMNVTITAPNYYPHEGIASVVFGSDGHAAIDGDYYTHGDTVRLSVADLDLMGNGTQSVTLDTSVGLDVETLILNETGPSTGTFNGTIETIIGAVVHEDGKLQITNGETITLRYIDADDGQGGINVEKTDTAEADTAPPSFAGLVTAEPGETQVTLSWDAASDPRTPITYNIYRAESFGAQDFNSPLDSTTDTTFIDDTVTNGLRYYYVVRAQDVLCNEESNFIEKSAMPIAPSTIYFFPLDTDPGWSCEGDWSFGQPTGQGGEYGGPDPTEGYTGLNVYGYNLDGDYTNDIASTLYLTTSPIDCGEYTSIGLKFRRWLGVEQPLYDHAYIEVSNDNSNWDIIWSNTSVIEDTSWSIQEYDISSIADNQETVYIRWGLGPTDSSWRYCGWNIDDIEILGIGSDVDGDGLPDTWEQQIIDNDPYDGIETIWDVLPEDDYDNDGLTNGQEYLLQLDPTNPNTDGDGFNDGDEVERGTDPSAFTYYVDDADGDDSYDGALPDLEATHGPKKTIQGAVNSALSGEEIMIMWGTYTGQLNRDINPGAKALAIRGFEGAAFTVIDCGTLGRGFYYNQVGDSRSLLEGLTIINGYASDYGGAVFCNESSLTIRNCVIESCFADLNGGGIYCNSSDGVEIVNGLITSNSSDSRGGGIFTAGTNISISSCTIADNSAVVNGGGASFGNASVASVTDTIFYGNSAPEGDQISLARPVNPSSLSITFSDIEGGEAAISRDGCTLEWGAGCIDSDPLFVSGDLGDYYLSQTGAGQGSDSPCVDTGSDTSENLGLFELATRTDNVADTGTVDMGYHYPGPLVIESIQMAVGGIVITWNARPGTAYTVQLSIDMEIWNDIPVGETGAWIDKTVIGSQKYYRVFEQ